MKIVSLTKQNLDPAADSLSWAFYADPLQSYVFPDAHEWLAAVDVPRDSAGAS